MTFPCKEGQGSHKRGNRNGKQSICMYSPCPVHQGPSRASGLLPFPDEGRGDASRLTAIIPIRQASRTREIGRRGNFPDVFTILTTSSPSHLHGHLLARSPPPLASPCADLRPSLSSSTHKYSVASAETRLAVPSHDSITSSTETFGCASSMSQPTHTVLSRSRISDGGQRSQAQR